MSVGKDSCDMKQALLLALRDRSAPSSEFRRASDEIARLLCDETMQKLGCEESATALTPSGGVMIVPILRAALSLLPAFTSMMPEAPVGIVGVERDESTALPRLYYKKFPSGLPRRAIILDPMLATGGTACLAAELLIREGLEADDIYFSGVLAAPEGLDSLSAIIPRSNITLVAVDSGLDTQKFIVPGLGDYGDRYYGTQPT